jgi:hypothetical protein
MSFGPSSKMSPGLTHPGAFLSNHFTFKDLMENDNNWKQLHECLKITFQKLSEIKHDHDLYDIETAEEWVEATHLMARLAEVKPQLTKEQVKQILPIYFGWEK